MKRLRRARAIAAKEVRHIMRDPQVLVFAFGMPVILLLGARSLSRGPGSVLARDRWGRQDTRGEGNERAHRPHLRTRLA